MLSTLGFIFCSALKICSFLVRQQFSGYSSGCQYNFRYNYCGATGLPYLEAFYSGQRNTVDVKKGKNQKS